MADMFAIELNGDRVYDSTRIWEDIDSHNLIVRFSKYMMQPWSRLFEQGYRCIQVTVTTKTWVDCKNCEWCEPDPCNSYEKICMRLEEDCTNGSEFKPSAPIQLYNVTGE